MVGMAVHPDGTIFARCDIHGAYVKSTIPRSGWRRIINSESLPSLFLREWWCGGPWEIAIDPQNSNNLWLFHSPSGYSGTAIDRVLKSTDKGVTWALTGFTPVTCYASGSDRYTQGQHIAVDPHHANTVYVGTKSGCFVTHDGGTTFSNLTGPPPSGVPSSATGTCAICIDPASGTNASGYTNRVIVGVQGKGFYLTVDGGTTWSGPTGPTSIGHGKMGANSTYYCTSQGTGVVSRMTTGNVWSTILSDGQGYSSIAPDPNNPARLWTCVYGRGNFTHNANVGTPTWSGRYDQYCNMTAPDCAWIENSFVQGNRNIVEGEICWDPLSVAITGQQKTIGTGAFDFIVPSGLNIVVGQMLRIFPTGLINTATYLLGTVQSYSGTALKVVVVARPYGSGAGKPPGIGGSGTYSNWTIGAERVWCSHGIGVGYTEGPEIGASTQTPWIDDILLGSRTWLPAIACGLLAERPCWRALIVRCGRRLAQTRIRAIMVQTTK